MNKVALVTGAGTGIGRVIAIKLAKAGYDVALHYNGSSEGADSAVKEITNIGRKAVAIQADFSKYEEINKLFSEFLKYFSRLDLFVNNSGITKKSEFLETDEETFDLMCDVNLKGSYFCMQNAAKIMVDKNIQGSMVVISSNNYKAHFADVSVYGSLKAGLTKMAEHIAIELAQYKIRVNTIAPGWTDTGASRLDEKESTFYKIPLQKWTTSDEIADAVIYLASQSAISITGATLVIDNGALLVSDKRERYGF